MLKHVLLLVALGLAPAAAATAPPPLPQPPPPALTASPINGQTLRAIRYQGPEGHGSFVATPAGNWLQESAQGRKTYVQYGRLAWAVHLVELHRQDAGILIDLQRMKVSGLAHGQARADLLDIVEVQGPDGVFVSQVSAPPKDNCGGYLEAACTGRTVRCDEGLVESYTDGGATWCAYSSRKLRQLAAGAPFPVKYPKLDPAHPDHRQRLAGKTTVHIIPISFSGSKLRDVTVQASGADTIGDLIGIFAQRNKIDAQGITLSIQRQATGAESSEVVLDEKQSVAAYDLRSGTRLFVGQAPACTGIHCRIYIHFYPLRELSNVRMLGGSMPMRAADTVRQVKSLFLRPNDHVSEAFKKRFQLEDLTLTPAQITLMFEGQAMDDEDQTLASYGVGLDDFSLRIGIILRR